MTEVPPPQAPRTLALTLTSTPAQVMLGVEALQAFCRSHAVAQEATYGLMLALEEVTSNIVNHAYQRDATQSLRVFAELVDERIVVEVRDLGPPFDPSTPRPLARDGEPDEAAVGGLGIELIRRSVDQVHYAREGIENVLRLTKHLGRRI